MIQKTVYNFRCDCGKEHDVFVGISNDPVDCLSPSPKRNADDQVFGERSDAESTKQRYRPLAEGEIVEPTDSFTSYSDREINDKGWITTGRAGFVVRGGDRYRRAIPETDWRDPVGEAGYPYPPGTVVRTRDEVMGSDFDFVILDDHNCMSVGRKLVHRINKPRRHLGSKFPHRVIDYRPELLDEKAPVTRPATSEPLGDLESHLQAKVAELAAERDKWRDRYHDIADREVDSALEDELETIAASDAIAGKWYRDEGGYIVLATGCMDDDGDWWFVYDKADPSYLYPDDELKPLPHCTGFDWEPGEVPDDACEKSVYSMEDAGRFLGVPASVVARWYDNGHFNGYRTAEQERKILTESLKQFKNHPIYLEWKRNAPHNALVRLPDEPWESYGNVTMQEAAERFVADAEIGPGESMTVEATFEGRESIATLTVTNPGLLVVSGGRGGE